MTAFLERGGRKSDAWYAALAVVEVGFDDEPEGFANINTLDELNAFSAGDLTRDQPDARARKL